MSDKVGSSGAKWEKEVEEIGNYLDCNVGELKNEMLPVLQRAYLLGVKDMLEEIDYAMNNNDPKPGWWSRVRVLIRVKYDL